MEYRHQLAYTQLNIAKKLDPHDPTPWFYEASLLYSENRPIEALQSMERSIEKNDHRGVYRSRLLLDDDRTSRNAALGSLYQSLGFESLAVGPASLALASTPANPAAHRLLADSYLGQHRHNVARTNALLQAQLLSNVNTPMIQPQLLRSNRALLDHGGPHSPGYHEFNSLFLPNGAYGNLNFTAGGNSSLGADLQAGYIADDYSLHAGQYHLSTDGFFKNQDYQEDTTNVEVQWQISPATKLRFTGTQNEVRKGDVALRFHNHLTSPHFRTTSHQDTLSFGFTHTLSNNALLIGHSAYSRSKSHLNSLAPTAPPHVSQAHSENETDTDTHHLEYHRSTPSNSWLVGAQHKASSSNHRLEIDYFDTPTVSPDVRSNNAIPRRDSRLYGYAYTRLGELTLTTGVEAAHVNNPLAKENTTWLPKLGLNWPLNSQTDVGIAAFKSLSSALNPASYTSLTPTQVSGFDQLFTGSQRSESSNIGLSIDHTYNPQLKLGLRLRHQSASSPHKLIFHKPSQETRFVEIDSSLEDGVVWLYWMPSNVLSLSFEHHIEKFQHNFEQRLGTSPNGIETLHTQRSPLTVSYHHPSGLSAKITSSYIQQDGIFWKSISSGETPSGTKKSNEFWLTDISVSYRLSKNHGILNLGVKNAFNQTFNYEDIGSYEFQDIRGSGMPSIFASERLWFGTLSLSF